MKINEFEALERAIHNLTVSIWKSIEPVVVYCTKKLTELIIYLDERTKQLRTNKATS